ncbi:MAG: class I SAM-dependent methyltransferase [Candidatus Hydrogenedentes bacterium]|nr:class I SAM-dependent methyltransferase [Candidatus Hydrogenedentota bacterium]
MYRVEDGHWWYAGLRGVLRHYWGRFVQAGRPRMLDVGCGTGATLSAWADTADCTGVDFSAEALRFCRKRGLERLAAGSASDLPFADESFDAVVSFDVICHRSIPDKIKPLQEMYRILRPGGVLLLNLPAYQWLHSSHDIYVYTDKRFTRREAFAMLRQTGFHPLAASYWNTLLFPPILLTRLWRKLRPPTASDLDTEPSGALNAFFKGVMAVERALMRAAPLPFGLSVFLAARK